MKEIKILLVDDHFIVRNGIKQLLENQDNMTVVGEAGNGQEAIEQIKALNPDVVVMDVGMPVLNGVEALAEIKKQGISSKILMLSMYDAEDYVIKAVENGALGYVLKDADEQKFIAAIQTVNEGKRYYGHDISGLIIDHFMTGSPAKTQKELSSEDFDLSKRERDILQLVSSGQSNKQIADQLEISVRTIETHRLNIMKKMKVNNVAEMVKVAIENQLV